MCTKIQLSHHIVLFIYIENIYYLLQNSLHSVRDAQFIDTFKKQFLKDVLIYNRHFLKHIQSHDNPLFNLINIDKQQNRQNKLVKDLIDRATSLIEINEVEILNDTFYRPSRENFTYAILFNESLNSFPIYTQVMDYLKIQLKKWITEGVMANDVWTWQGFSNGQSSIVRKIWPLVIQATGGTYQIDEIFDATHRDMQAKLEMKEKIVTCLDVYCQYASDKGMYHAEVREWHRRFERESIKSIEIPKMLQDIVPFAEKLNPYRNARSWRTFLNRRMAINSKF